MVTTAKARKKKAIPVTRNWRRITATHATSGTNSTSRARPKAWITERNRLGMSSVTHMRWNVFGGSLIALSIKSTVALRGGPVSSWSVYRSAKCMRTEHSSAVANATRLCKESTLNHTSYDKIVAIVRFSSGGDDRMQKGTRSSEQPLVLRCFGLLPYCLQKGRTQQLMNSAKRTDILAQNAIPLGVWMLSNDLFGVSALPL